MVIAPEPGVAVAHGLKSVVVVRQGLPLIAVDDRQQVLVEEDHVGHVGVRVHGMDQLVVLGLGRLDDDRPAVQQVVVVGARGRDGRRLAGRLVRRREGAVRRHPVLAVVRQLARVARARVRAGDPAVRDLDVHHLVDVLQDHLVAVE